MSYFIFCSASFLAGYLICEFGGVLEMFDFDEKWVAKQHETFKKIVDSFFK